MTAEPNELISPLRPVIRVSEVRNEEGVLTHKMCCLCMNFIAVEDLWVCKHGEKWDSCYPCAPFLGRCNCEEDK